MTTDTGSFVPLDKSARAILTALLAEPFPGRDEVALQVEVAEARLMDNDGSLALRAPDAAPAQVMYRVPVEGIAPDVDGVGIHVLLHVVDGLINEMEVYREDGQLPKGPIVPATMKLVTLPAT